MGMGSEILDIGNQRLENRLDTGTGMDNQIPLLGVLVPLFCGRLGVGIERRI
jgi:hypothetical protein